MSAGLLGKKLGMTQVYDDSGACIPVTVLRVGPCTVIQSKTIESDGYMAVQIGFEKLTEKKGNRPALGRFRAAKVDPCLHIREFRVDDAAAYPVGLSLDVGLFQSGDRVDISGVTKGKGFQGVMKRHGHQGGPAAHGSRFHRTPGSIGQCTTPGEVAKGTKLPGHMGAVAMTTKNLQVIAVRSEDNSLMVKGAVPGANNGLVFVRLPESIVLKRLQASAAAPQEEGQAEEPVEEVKATTEQKAKAAAEPAGQVDAEKDKQDT